MKNWLVKQRNVTEVVVIISVEVFECHAGHHAVSFQLFLQRADLRLIVLQAVHAQHGFRHLPHLIAAISTMSTQPTFCGWPPYVAKVDPHCSQG